MEIQSKSTTDFSECSLPSSFLADIFSIVCLSQGIVCKNICVFVSLPSAKIIFFGYPTGFWAVQKNMKKNRRKKYIDIEG